MKIIMIGHKYVPSREGGSLKKQPHAMSDIRRVVAVVSDGGAVPTCCGAPMEA